MPNVDKTLAELAAKLGTSVDKLWPILVHKVIVDWWAETLITLAILPLVVWWFRHTLKCLAEFKEKNKDDKYPDDMGVTFHVAISGIVLGGALFIVLLHIATISTLWYPEATAIRQLMGK